MKLPKGAAVLGPNTISGLPHKGGFGEFCPPYADPPFEHTAAKVTIWFRTWDEAREFAISLETEK